MPAEAADSRLGAPPLFKTLGRRSREAYSTHGPGKCRGFLTWLSWWSCGRGRDLTVKARAQRSTYSTITQTCLLFRRLLLFLLTLALSP